MIQILKENSLVNLDISPYLPLQDLKMDDLGFLNPGNLIDDQKIKEFNETQEDSLFQLEIQEEVFEKETDETYLQE